MGAKVVVEEAVSVALEEIVSVSVEVVVPDSVRDIVGVMDENSEGEKEASFSEPFLDFFDDFLELLLPFELPLFEELEDDDPLLPLLFEDLELPKISLSVLGVGFG